MMNKYHTAGTTTCYKISSGWQHKPFWWRAKWECTFLLIQKWDLRFSRNCVHYLFFSSSHCHFYTTSQPSDLAPRIPQECSPTSHMQLMTKDKALPYRVFWEEIVLCNFLIHSTGFCIICTFDFGKSVTSAQSTHLCESLSQCFNQELWSSSEEWSSIKFCLLSVFLHYKEDNTMTCKIPLPEGFWKFGTLSYWPSTV